MKKCPYCAEEIQDEAIKCKHCGSILSNISQNNAKVIYAKAYQTQQPPKKNKIGFWGWVVIILVAIWAVIMIMNVLLGTSDISTNTNSSSVQNNLDEIINATPDFVNANKGDANAQLNLGRCYYNGKGVTQDYNEAFKWYKKAAGQGNADAQNNLGVMYQQGYSVSQNYTEAFNWYSKSVKQGNALAQCNLGSLFAVGKGVKQDYNEAAKWFTKAAEQGEVIAQLELGLCHYKGLGTKQDYSEAAKWFRKSAEQGNADAQFFLGGLFYQGEGVTRNYSEAAKWFRKSAEQGNADAQFCLGGLFCQGEGVTRNYSEAAKWFRKSAEQGNIQAQDNLRNMTSESNNFKGESKKIYKEGDDVSIGYTSYSVSRSIWSNHLSDNEFLDQKPDAMFLLVELTVKNNDKKPRSIPPFKLIDENGAEYETSSKSFAMEGSIGVLDSLNPSVQKHGYIVFDIPTNHQYKLKASGGYWSSEDAFIELSPKSKVR